MQKRDQYKECNDQPDVPLEDFQLQFCSRCVRPDCTRSQYGKSKFDQRVTTWKSRLFIDIPRMSPQDPRFEGIQAHRFHEIDTSRVPDIQGWVDPRALGAEAPVQEPESVEQVQPQTVVREPKSQQDRRGQVVKTTKLVAGSTKPVSDPWEPKKKPTGKVVQPGVKIRLGSGSNQ